MLVKNQLKSIVRIVLTGMSLLFAVNTSLSAFAATTWPKVITTPKGDITVYQPTPESLDGTSLAGRAAVSVRVKDSSKPVFGAIWITSNLVVDRDTRIAVLTDIKIPNIRFSEDVDTEVLSKITNLIEEEMPKWKLEVSMDDLISTLESASVESDSKFKNDPPEIIIANRPSVLVLIDGNPILKKLEGYEFQRVENSPFFIVFDPKEKSYFIYGDKIWFASRDIKGPWEQNKNISSSLKKLGDEIDKSENEQDQVVSLPESQAGNPPDVVPSVIVRTSPAELIVITGEPNFTPITGTNLLYVSNTESNVFMDIQSQNYFILISGRWYRSEAMTGPWSFVEADKLPAEFTKIPEGSEKDLVLASVAGTKASKEAVLDAQIPQTAEVDRKTATVTVEYDGEPKFEKVNGTTMLYAVNSPQTVLKVSNNYYCVDNGVWFESASARGPWRVADQRPEEVEKIEPSSPVYNVKYVYVYYSTPQVVYVGYTPGYYGCYVYGPTVIYGTGYPYYPWYGTVYYPRPVTYGFGMHYNPYTGWGMSFRVSYGPIHISFGSPYYHGGFYGPPMYRPPYHYHPHGGGYYGRPPGYNPGNRPAQGGRPSQLPASGGGSGNPGRHNIYTNNRAGVNPNIAQPSTGNTSGNRAATPKQQPNNIYTDKSGNVYQKTNKGWEQRQGNNWQSADKAATRPSTGSGGTSNRPATGTTRPSTGSSNSSRPATLPSVNTNDLNRQAANRDRGMTRTSNSYNYSGAAGRSASMPTRSPGAAGGGARRR